MGVAINWKSENTPEPPKVFQKSEAPRFSATNGNGMVVMPKPARLMNTTSHNTPSLFMDSVRDSRCRGQDR